MAKRIPRVTDPAKPPHNAVFFDVWRLHKQEGVNPEGKRYSTYKPKRMTGGVAPDGRVNNRWAVEELSPEAILGRWGSGRYRVRYLGAGGELVGSVDWELQSPPTGAGEPLAPQVDAGAAAGDGSPGSRLRGVAGRLDGPGVIELMLLLDDARDRAAARERAEAERVAARDRQFFQQQQAQWKDMMGMLPQANPAAAAGPPVDMARELALLRRELSLTVREESAKLRAEVLSQIPEDTPPAASTFEEALNGAGVGMVEGVGAEVPGLVNAALSRLKTWLAATGTPATPENLAAAIEAIRAAAAAEAHANGAG